MAENRPVGSPADELLQTFIDATVVVPQVPYGGVIEVGDKVVSLVDQGLLTVHGYAEMTLEGSRLRHAAQETVRVHGDASVPNNQGLRKGLPLAWELVQSGFVHGVALLRDGNDAVRTESILPVSPLEVTRVDDFLSHARNRTFVRALFDAARHRLAEHDVTEELERYQLAIAGISREYVDTPATDTVALTAKQGELNVQRGMLMGVAGPAIHEALAPYAGRPGVMAFAGAIACAKPSDALFRKYGLLN